MELVYRVYDDWCFLPSQFQFGLRLEVRVCEATKHGLLPVLCLVGFTSCGGGHDVGE